MKSLLALVPVYQSVSAPGFRSLMALTKNAGRYFNFNYQIHTGSYIPVARNLLMRAAYLQEPDYVLCIDTDQVFTINDVLNLIKHYDDSDYDILSGDIYIRGDKLGMPKNHMAYDFDSEGHVVWKDLTEGITKVDGTGFGFLLMSGKVLTKIVKGFNGAPLFDTAIESRFLDKPFKYSGEDVYFFRKVKELGLKAGVDADVHIGHHGFSE